MLEPKNEGPSNISETLQPTDVEEELQHTKEDPQITSEGCERAEDSGPQSEHKTEKGHQSTDDSTKQTKEHLQPTDGGGIKEKDR